MLIVSLTGLCTCMLPGPLTGCEISYGCRRCLGDLVGDICKCKAMPLVNINVGDLVGDICK